MINEDFLELNEETKKEIIKAEKEYKLGKVKSLEQIKKEMKIKMN